MYNDIVRSLLKNKAGLFMYLYRITNTISGTIYIGVTKTTVYKRFRSHVNAAKRGVKYPLYDAMRSYGLNNFIVEQIGSYNTENEMLSAEEQILRYIKATKIKVYNIRDGGNKKFAVRDKESWRQALSVARQGGKPALGMKHTEENKKKFGEYGKFRWDIYGRYPKEVLNYSFKEANKLFGISKTHYYRLRKENTAKE